MSKQTKMKQTTLAAFNFTKSVEHRGEQTEINIPNYIGIETFFLIKCPHCDPKFKNKQGLGVHIKCLHGTLLLE